MTLINEHLSHFLNELSPIKIKIHSSEVIDAIEQFIRIPYTSIKSIDIVEPSSYVIVKNSKYKIFVFQCPPEDFFTQKHCSMFDLSILKSAKIGQKLQMDLLNKNHQFTVLRVIKGQYLLGQKEAILEKIKVSDVNEICPSILDQIIQEKKAPYAKELFAKFVNHLDLKKILNFTDIQLEAKITELIKHANFSIPESREASELRVKKITEDLNRWSNRNKFRKQAADELKKDIVGQALMDENQIKSDYVSSYAGEFFFANLETLFEIEMSK